MLTGRSWKCTKSIHIKMRLSDSSTLLIKRLLAFSKKSVPTSIIATASRRCNSTTSTRNQASITNQPQETVLLSNENENEESEPSYGRSNKHMEEIVIHSPNSFLCQHGGILPNLNVAYEAWGELNSARDNTILLCHGLSASAHAKSHENNPESALGWWEKFIGPDLPLDTKKFYIICVNLLGSCFGTSGPSTINTDTGRPYGSDFPIISIEDMVRAKFLLLDLLGIEKVHAVVGSSLGGMVAFAAASLFNDRVNRMVSISAGGRSPPSSIAYRYLQRVALMNDPKWRNGHYYDNEFPVDGTRLARKIATLTYRSGPEWEKRFRTEKIEHAELPRYHGPEFLIEDYIRHQGESFLMKTKFDPNSLIYLSKAMDLFDMSEGFESMEEGFSTIKCPSLVMGATSDILYPITKQQEAAELIQRGGNKDVILHVEEGYYGHDTFLLDVDGMGTKMKDFVEA